MLTLTFRWPVATYSCESWILRKNEETRPDAFGVKGLRKILRVSWTAKKTNEWVLNKDGVKRELLHTVKAWKLAYYSHTMSKELSGKETMYPNFAIRVTVFSVGQGRPAFLNLRL